jgi:hypothetical protein
MTAVIRQLNNERIHFGFFASHCKYIELSVHSRDVFKSFLLKPGNIIKLRCFYKYFNPITFLSTLKSKKEHNSMLSWAHLQTHVPWWKLWSSEKLVDLSRHMIRTKLTTEVKDIQNPNSCSRRIPMKRRLSMFASKWKTPACNHMQEMRRQLWCLCTTLFTSKAPIFSKLPKKERNKQIHSKS